MKIERGKFFAILILLAAFLIGTINSISITGLSVLDTDPSTYIIVVMLMIFVFIAFSVKERLKLEFSKRNIAYGILAFIAYAILVSYLRVALSFAFTSYRIDALLFPILLFAMIIALFGYDGVKKLKQVIVYSIFASPLFLLPIISLNNAFANANVDFVYSVLRSIGIQVAKVGLVITAPSSASITISTTCVSIGTFIALIMFLIPVAYFYNGKIGKKVVWIVSAFVLMLLLNFARMLAIALVWAYYGLGSAITTFHAFAGQLIFYAVIIAMLLLAYKFGMSLNRKGKAKEKFAKAAKLSSLTIQSALVLAFGVIAFIISTPYGSAISAPATLFSANATYSSLNPYLLTSLENAGMNVTYLGATNVGQLFGLDNSQNSSNATYVMVNGALRPIAGAVTLNHSTISGLRSYVLKNGIVISGGTAESGNSTFDIAYFSMPYNISGSYVSANYELFKRVGSSGWGCRLGSPTILGAVDYVQSFIYNIFMGSYAAQDSEVLCESYLIASSQK